MFERYNESARRLLFFSRYEASELGSLSIESEHLLLGLVRECQGIVLTVLQSFAVSPDELREDVRTHAELREKLSTAVEIPFSPDTRQILVAAAGEADRLQHGYIGPEHLLLGLLHAEGSRAAGLLNARGLTLDTVRRKTMDLVAGTPDDSSPVTGGEAAEQIDAAKQLVDQLGALPAGSPEARELVTRIHQALAVVRRFVIR